MLQRFLIFSFCLVFRSDHDVPEATKNQQKMVQIEEWWNTMPPITKAYFVAALGSTLAVQANVISPYALYLDFDLVVSKLEVRHPSLNSSTPSRLLSACSFAQIWRLVTCFCFFGKFSMGFVMNMFMLANYGRGLEQGCACDSVRLRHVVHLTFRHPCAAPFRARLGELK